MKHLSKLFKIAVSLFITLALAIALIFSPHPALAQVSSWQKGASIEPTSPGDFGSEAFKQSITNLAATGADYVTLIIPYYQSSLVSSDLTAGWNTPTDEALITGIDYAHSLGLKVMLKMHPEIITEEWRGFINPDNRNVWFTVYGDVVNHYATIAQEHGVEEICLGAEMFHLTTPGIHPDNTNHWRALIYAVRQNYDGLLTYSAQHSNPDEAAEIEFWDDLDYIGYAAYWPLCGDKENPTTEEMAAAWDAWNKSVIAPTQQKWGKPVLFTEIGYRSLDGSHADPWSWWRAGSADETEQAKNYEVLFSYWNQFPYMQGVHLWKWEVDPDAGGPSDSGFTPQNKQAEEVMKEWFGGQAQPTPTPTPTQDPEEPFLSPTPTQPPVDNNQPTPTAPPDSLPEPVTPPASTIEQMKEQVKSQIKDWHEKRAVRTSELEAMKNLIQSWTPSENSFYWQTDGSREKNQSMAELKEWLQSSSGGVTCYFILKANNGEIISQHSLRLIIP